MEDDAEGRCCFATRRLGRDGVVIGNDREIAVDVVWISLESTHSVT